MVSYEPQIGMPFYDRVIGGEVVYPEERLSAELYGVRHEVEHRYPDRHLYEHRETSGHHTHAVFLLEEHYLLLLLHLVLRLVEVFCLLVQDRAKHTHLGRRHVALLHHRIGDSLENEGDKYNHDAHRYAERCQPVEDVECKPAVDDAEQRPAEIYKTLQLEFLSEGRLLLHILQETEIIRAIVELKLRSACSCWVERRFQACRIVFEVSAALLVRHT